MAVGVQALPQISPLIPRDDRLIADEDSPPPPTEELWHVASAAIRPAVTGLDPNVQSASVLQLDSQQAIT